MMTAVDQFTALRTATGLARLEDRAFVRFTGTDRARWLNGMVTNNVQQLQPGEGSYNFFLNAQGRIQGDGYIFNDGESFLLETTSNQRDKLTPLLDHFIIMDDVELTPTMDGQTGLTLIGPNAPALLDEFGPGKIRLQHNWLEKPILFIAIPGPIVPHYEFWGAPEAIDAFEKDLLNAGVTACDDTSIEALRILEGTPLYGKDIRDRDLPQETAQTRALHFTKGCYLGQEIVERIRSRGSVHRTLTGFTLEGILPSGPTPLEAGGKPAGELTSILTLPTGAHLALGYARREALNLPLQYPGGTATPVPLPFQNF
jgi:folate-binding protein YgfZ